MSLLDVPIGNRPCGGLLIVSSLLAFLALFAPPRSAAWSALTRPALAVNIVEDMTPIFSWDAVERADFYELRIYEFETNTCVARYRRLIETTLSVSHLFGGIQYYATLRAGNDTGEWSRWSTLPFQLELGRPLVIIDSSGKIPIISWTRPAKAGSFRVRVHDARLPEQPLVHAFDTGSTTYEAIGVSSGRYSISVKAKHNSEPVSSPTGLLADHTVPVFALRAVPAAPIMMWGYDDNRLELWQTAMEAVNIIEGVTTDAELVKNLRAQGKLFAYHVGNPAADLPDADQVVEVWSKPFRNTLSGLLPGGFDAIAIDEANARKDETPASRRFIAALARLRQQFPERVIIVAGTQNLGLSRTELVDGESYDAELRAIRDHADLYFQEIYRYESQERLLPRLGTIAGNLDRIPALLNKTIAGISIAQAAGHDNDPKVNFKDFIDAQLHLLRNDPRASKIPGIGFWTFYRANPTTILHVLALLRHYYRDGRSDYFGDGSFASTALSDPSFENAPGAWLLSGGAGVSLARPMKNLPMWHIDPICAHGSRLLVMAKEDGRVSKAEQKLALDPHTTYALSVWVTGPQSAVRGRVDISDSNGAQLLRAPFNCRYPTSAEDAAQRWQKVTFRFTTGADGKETTILLSNYGAARGRVIYWDFIELEEDYQWNGAAENIRCVVQQR